MQGFHCPWDPLPFQCQCATTHRDTHLRFESRVFIGASLHRNDRLIGQVAELSP